MIDIQFDRFRDYARKMTVDRVRIEGILQIDGDEYHNVYDPPHPSEGEMKARLLSALSKEMTGGIRDTLEHTLRSLSAVRGASEECDKALAVAQSELHSVIELLNSGMHLLRVDKMLGGSGD